MPKNVIIIGAGIVGVSCALWAQRRGHHVTLIDRDEPGNGTSFGNACTIADYACVPVNSPNLIRNLPKLMFAKDSPLSVDLSYAISNLGWMLQFLKSCRTKDVTRITNTLGTILSATQEGLDPLIQESNAENLFQNNGCLYIYKTKQAFDAAKKSNQARADNGVAFEIVDTNEIADLEPHIRTQFYGGLLFSNARHTINPKALVEKFFATFIANGGEFIQANARAINQSQNGVLLENGVEHLADKIVIACGAFSKCIINNGTQKIPLDTERGYHVQFTDRQSLLTRPVGWADAGFYATPTNEGLRFAGTVEIAGLDKSINQGKIDYLTMKAKEMFTLDEEPDQTWLGFRPTLPDALPVIGHSKPSKNILYAFGHQHIGLTLGGITGKVISELIDDVAPCIDIAPFLPARFR